MFKRLFRRGTPPAALSSLDAYARWAASYPPHAHNVLMQAEERAMRSLLPELHGANMRRALVFDLACGTGRYGQILQQAGAGRVFSLDNSLPMLEAGRPPGAICATVEALPLPDASASGVICALALGHLPRLGPAMSEIARVLKPGGWALISDFHPFLALSGSQRTFQAGGQTYSVEHYAHLYSDYHAAVMGAGLRIEAIAEPRLLPQGPAPDGTPADSSPAAPVAAGTPVVLALRLRKP